MCQNSFLNTQKQGHWCGSRGFSNVPELIFEHSKTKSTVWLTLFLQCARIKSCFGFWLFFIMIQLTVDLSMNIFESPNAKHQVTNSKNSFTRGEGFGRPLLEATISGKPMVVSAWSGQTDFLNNEMVTTVGGKLTQVHPSAADNFILKDASWFEIDYNLAGGTMKDIFDNYKKYLTKSRKHRQYTKDNFTWEHMRDLLSEQLKDADSAKVSPTQVGLQL